LDGYSYRHVLVTVRGMSGGPISTSPWVVEIWDYQHRMISITVPWNTGTRAQQGATLHRDSGCVYNWIILGDPNDSTNTKAFQCPADGQADSTTSAQQLRNNGLTTIDDVVAVQVTASPVKPGG
jgi:hypothetical protein